MTDSPHLVYCKTAKGLEEIGKRQHNLQHRQRSTLILMDCAKNLGLISTAIPMSELEITVPFLMQSGFIVLAKNQPPQIKSSNAKPHPIITNDVNLVSAKSKSNIATTANPPHLTQNPESIATAKQIMNTTANTYLGLMGTEIINRIQRCHTSDQVLGAAAYWHMALRESKIGTVVATDLLADVKKMLHYS